MGSSVDPSSRRRSRSARRTVACLATAALVAAACSSDDGTIAEPDATDPPPTSVSEATTTETPTTGVDHELGAIELAATTGDPFDRIAVTGLDGLPTDQIALWMRSPDPGTIPDDVFVPVYLPDVEDATGVAELVVPFHPVDPMVGGDVELYFAHGEERTPSGPTIEFTIGSMPAAPGAWNGFLDDYRAEIDRAAAELGSSADELAATDVDEVPDELLPLRISLAILDDGTEHSLADVYDSALLTEDDRTLLDALTARIDPARAFTPAGEPVGFRSPSAPPATPAAAIGTATRPVGRPGTPAPTQSADCRSADITVADAADLADKLTKALDYTITPGGPVETVLQDLGTVTTVGGFIPVVGTTFGIAGAVVSGIEAYHNGISGLYPSRVTSIDTTIDTERFFEDFVVNGGWGDVTVVAASTGWNATNDVTGIVLTGVSLGAGNHLGDGLDLVEAFGLDVGLMTGESLAGQLVEDLAPNLVNFCAQEWEVDVTGEPWSFATVQQRQFETNDAVRSYWPVDIGQDVPFDDLLRVELNYERFRNQMIYAEFDISVARIDVSGPREVEVDNPGDLVDVDFTVENAHDISLELDADHGDWVDGPPTYIDGDPLVQRHTHITTGDEDAYPYIVLARSAASTGLRTPGAPQRVATVRVRLRDLIVTPGSATLLPGNQIQFTATDRDGNPVEVEWSATGGTIDADGVYTAGDTPGTFEVTAVDPRSPDRPTTVPVTIGEGDACLVGTWQLDNEAFVATMEATLDRAMELGGQMPPGVETSWRFDGPFYLHMDDHGRAVGWRNGWQMIQSGSVQGTTFENTTTIDSVERFSYTVEGDEGDRIRMSDIAVRDITVRGEYGGTTVVVTPDAATSSMFGHTVELEADTGVDDAPQSAAASYTCSDDRLEFTFDQVPGAPMSWIRAAEAPDPPTT